MRIFDILYAFLIGVRIYVGPCDCVKKPGMAGLGGGRLFPVALQGYGGLLRSVNARSQFHAANAAACLRCDYYRPCRRGCLHRLGHLRVIL